MGGAWLATLAFLTAGAAPLTADSAQFGTSWLRFSKDVQIRHGDVEVDIGTLAWDREADRLVFWARRTRHEPDGSKTVDWIKSDTCPGFDTVLDTLEGLPLATPAVPGRSSDLGITVDGILYRLETSARYEKDGANLSLRSNLDTPLAKFVEASLTVLEPCWSKHVPQRAPYDR